MRRPGVQSIFQLISKVFSVVEVRTTTKTTYKVLDNCMLSILWQQLVGDSYYIGVMVRCRHTLVYSEMIQKGNGCKGDNTFNCITSLIGNSLLTFVFCQRLKKDILYYVKNCNKNLPTGA